MKILILRLSFPLLTLYFLASNSAGIPTDDRNWPPFFPIIHHDIPNEIPAHAQRLQYLAFASWLGMSSFIFIFLFGGEPQRIERLCWVFIHHDIPNIENLLGFFLKEDI